MLNEDVLYLTPDVPGGPGMDFQANNEIAESNPPIIIPGIDEDGKLYPIEKIEAHRKGVHHLALSAFIFDGDELLIQRRAFSKYHCGGQWANTCCTHPHMGEEIEVAVKRRLQEELGFSVPVTHKRIVEYSADVGNGLWERERVHMFIANVSKADIEENLNPEEVCEIRWITADELHKDMKINPGNYTPWFKIYVDRFPKLNF